MFSDPENINFAESFSFIFIALVYFLFEGFLTILIFIFILIGVIYLYSGRHEFDQEHTKNIEYGLLLLIVGVIVARVVGFLEGLIYPLHHVLAMITPICFGLAIVLVLNRLHDDKGLRNLKISAIFLILFYMIAKLILLWIDLYVIADLTSEIESDTASVESSLGSLTSIALIGMAVGGITLIPWLMLTVSTKTALNNVRTGTTAAPAVEIPMAPGIPARPSSDIIEVPYPPPSDVTFKLEPPTKVQAVPKSELERKLRDFEYRHDKQSQSMPIQTRNCPSCNVIISQDDRRCPNCGRIL
jgi:ssDNA-binding Zn-finger/Zn-ribbon topoisomerase 1